MRKGKWMRPVNGGYSGSVDGPPGKPPTNPGSASRPKPPPKPESMKGPKDEAVAIPIAETLVIPWPRMRPLDIEVTAPMLLEAWDAAFGPLYERDQSAEMRVLAGVLRAVYDGLHGLKPDTHEHTPVQHRDGKRPWCKVCGFDADGNAPKGIFERRTGPGYQEKPD